jgi:hypothetical protein
MLSLPCQVLGGSDAECVLRVEGGDSASGAPGFCLPAAPVSFLLSAMRFLRAVGDCCSLPGTRRGPSTLVGNVQDIYLAEAHLPAEAAVERGKEQSSASHPRSLPLHPPTVIGGSVIVLLGSSLP